MAKSKKKKSTRQPQLDQIFNKKTLKILKNPIFVICSMAVGIYIGLNHKDLAQMIKPYGILYLKLLQMSVIPVLLASVISSIGRISDVEAMKNFVFKYFAVYILASFFIAFAGLIGGFATAELGLKIDDETREKIGQFIETSATSDFEVSLSQPYVPENEASGFSSFILDMVPDNIFKSLVSGATIQLVFFAVIVGISLNFLSYDKKKPLIDICISVFLAFQRFIGSLIYLLPFGIICLLSAQIAEVGLDLIQSMLSFIVIFYVISILLVIACLFIIWMKSKQSLRITYNSIIQPILIAFITRSSFAAIPASVDSMEKLRYDRMVVNLVIPLGITLGRYGNILFFALVSIFTFYLYDNGNLTLGLEQIIVIALGSVIAGLATTGATGFATLSMVAIILKPLGLPFETVILIFTAIDIIIDPIRSMLIVVVNLAVTSLVSNKYEGVRKPVEE